ncbi:MAG: bifunctional N-acetylglucosamine-1-phosphate uridyltransferase/glucosamine-1-phosphate acetyltransferase, partial [Bradymonadaceae bacterium]
DRLGELCSGSPDNAQGEFYLTDLVEPTARQRGVYTWRCQDADIVRGVNTRSDLARANDLLRQRINEHWMDQGVTFIDPDTTWIHPSVQLDRDVVLYPNVHLEGETVVGSGTVVETGCTVRHTKLGEDVLVKAQCYLESATVDSDTNLGPFAHLRPGADIGSSCKVGNYVEVKKARLEDGVKAGHLAYIGDAHLGERTNIGAGTITCNYDGEEKNRTEIGEGAFTGSNSSLVAPLSIGDGAYIGAGSTITDDVPPEALALGRGRQRNIEGWASEDD